jgi:hypothetical protein
MLSNFSQYAPQGWAPQLNSPSSGQQPGVYANAWPGHELGQQVPTWAGQINPFGQNPLPQPPLVANSQIPNSVQVIPVLGQLAQQLAIQCAITQQFAQHLSGVVQHLAHQLGAQGPQGQYYGQNPYAAAAQGAYPGFNLQAQAWSANRQATIQ